MPRNDTSDRPITTSNAKRKYRKQPETKAKICEACALDRPNPDEIMSDDKFIAVHTAMENLIYDTIHSNVFRDLLNQTKDIPPLYYQHFKYVSINNTTADLLHM